MSLLALGTICLIKNAKVAGANGTICEVACHNHASGAPYGVLWRGSIWGAERDHLIPLTPPSGDQRVLRVKRLEHSS